jgi:hypothetical protein
MERSTRNAAPNAEHHSLNKIHCVVEIHGAPLVASFLHILPNDVLLNAAAMLACRDIARALCSCRLFRSQLPAAVTALGDCNGRMTDSMLMFASRSFPRITSIDLKLCKGTTDKGLIALAANCKDIANINLQGCKDVTDDSVVALALGCKGIASINLSDCGVTDTGLITLAQNSESITNINFQGCKEVTDNGVMALALGCMSAKA